MNATNLIDKYASQSIRYLENAFEALNKEDYDKASEFLWGSVAEAIKAVAASKGVTLRSHVELWDWARMISKELGDENIYNAFFKANSLHSNFYEVRLKPEDVLIAVDSIRYFVGKLLRLLGYNIII